jgi:ATP-dependent DNA helicase RecG
MMAKSAGIDKTPVYPERESKNLEFKLKLPEFRTLVKTCIAFANCSGGEIIIGVEDGSRKIIGVSDKDRDRLYDEFPSSLYDAASPPLIPQIYEKSIADKVLMIIKIWPGDNTPYCLKSLGSPAGVFIRVGSSTRPANIQTIEDLQRDRKRIGYDEEISGHPISVLSEERLHHFFGRDISTRRLSAEKVIKDSPGGHGNSTATNGGILMFCDSPENIIPEAMIIVSRFAGIEGRHIIQTVELTGPIPLLADTTFTLLLQWLERDLKLKKAQLKGTPPIPAEALREGIINALLHRKYSIPGAIKIALYDDRLEIFSPGGFPGLISISNLGDGTTFLRNIVIARIARKMHLMEKLGSGIRLIFDSCRRYGIRKPEYNENGDFVKLTFFFENIPKTSELTEETILEMTRKSDILRPSDLSSEYNVSRNTISRRLDGLVKKKILIRYGKGAGVYYKLVE